MKGKVMTETKKSVKPSVSEPKKSKGLSYSQMLEARAQRGSMTHQKQFAINLAKKKEGE